MFVVTVVPSTLDSMGIVGWTSTNDESRSPIGAPPAAGKSQTAW